MASSLEEVSGGHGDFSGGSRSHDAPPDHFAVFKDFDFLEYESESIEVSAKLMFMINPYTTYDIACMYIHIFRFQGESSDNFNWGVRRHPLSGEIEVDTVLTGHQSHSSGVSNSLIGVETIPVNLSVDLPPNLSLSSSTHLDNTPLLLSTKSEVCVH